jgi:hypothetical protein
LVQGNKPIALDSLHKQRTLYGGSAMGVAIKYVTRNPVLDQFAVTAAGEIASDDHGGISYSGESFINLPLIDNRLALRLGGAYRFDAGYVDNIPEGQVQVWTRSATLPPAPFEPVTYFSQSESARQDYNDRSTTVGRVSAEYSLDDSLTTSGSLGSSQDCTTSALCALSVVEVAHLNFSWRGHLYAGAASRVYTIPNSLTDLCADEVLFEFACGPGTHRQSFALGLDIELQGLFDEPGRLRSLGFFTRVAKWAPLRWYLNLDPIELSNPFAGQIRFRMRRDTSDDGQERAQRDRIVASHDNLLGWPPPLGLSHLLSRSVREPVLTM